MDAKDIEIIMRNTEGNYYDLAGGLYISSANIEKLQELLNSCDDLIEILITPFLIRTKAVKRQLYELHYYEFVIGAMDVEQSHYIEYPQGNILPKEIVDHIKPRAIASKNDRRFYEEALSNYFDAMCKMTFEDDKQAIPELYEADLYYQIF